MHATWRRSACQPRDVRRSLRLRRGHMTSWQEPCHETRRCVKRECEESSQYGHAMVHRHRRRLAWLVVLALIVSWVGWRLSLPPDPPYTFTSPVVTSASVIGSTTIPGACLNGPHAPGCQTRANHAAVACLELHEYLAPGWAGGHSLAFQPTIGPAVGDGSKSSVAIVRTAAVAAGSKNLIPLDGSPVVVAFVGACRRVGDGW